MNRPLSELTRAELNQKCRNLNLSFTGSRSDVEMRIRLHQQRPSGSKPTFRQQPLVLTPAPKVWQLGASENVDIDNGGIVIMKKERMDGTTLNSMNESIKARLRVVAVARTSSYSGSDTRATIEARLRPHVVGLANFFLNEVHPKSHGSGHCDCIIDKVEHIVLPGVPSNTNIATSTNRDVARLREALRVPYDVVLCSSGFDGAVTNLAAYANFLKELKENKTRFAHLYWRANDDFRFFTADEILEALAFDMKDDGPTSIMRENAMWFRNVNRAALHKGVLQVVSQLSVSHIGTSRNNTTAGSLPDSASHISDSARGTITTTYVPRENLSISTVTVKSFACGVEDCDKRFANRSGLNHHKKWHENPDVTCKHCKETLKFRDLCGHQRRRCTAQPRRIVKCPVDGCDYETDPWHIKRHMDKSHDQVQDVFEYSKKFDGDYTATFFAKLASEFSQ
ncbi:hypothetical protein BU24DRAFT_491696 [Aaosphaeria arxii CBS 175.79]|uniref:C2H2-type domain-containing protein n=1 Tax=Aaosphaeria arxii CBS 175.79 TaxID=1450172 RepID=A0A6A5XQL1_9PLEO|nr:uncharacterized protein BU24DRAFT_491696 [Aaosphaeria arxii CBS 175.79]KAF2015452.1 hypothetical protein BU24DRAFT_491696 [Aaosphaeria arxii CBS 175.79]